MNTCNCEHTESCHVVDELSDAKGEIEKLNQVKTIMIQDGPLVAAYKESQLQLSDAKEQLQAYYNEAADGWEKFRQAESQLTTAKVEVETVNEQYSALLNATRILAFAARGYFLKYASVFSRSSEAIIS